MNKIINLDNNLIEVLLDYDELTDTSLASYTYTREEVEDLSDKEIIEKAWEEYDSYKDTYDELLDIPE